MRARLGTVVLTCPDTADQFTVGVEMDESSFQCLPSWMLSLHCPHCGALHTWDTLSARLELGARNLPRAKCDVNPRSVRAMA